MKFTVLIIPALLILTACSEFQYYSTTGFAPVTSKGHGADYWLTEMHETRAMSPEQHQVTRGLWEQEYANDPDIGNRLRLALLLSTGSESIRDLTRARELLENIEPEPETASDREMVFLLRQFIDEKLAADTEIKALKHLTKNNNRKIKELEEQQQALTNIEQNIQQRETQPKRPENDGQ